MLSAEVCSSTAAALLGLESCRQFLSDHVLYSVDTDCTLGVTHLFQYISKHSKVMGCLDFKENSTPNNGAAVIVKYTYADSFIYSYHLMRIRTEYGLGNTLVGNLKKEKLDT